MFSCLSATILVINEIGEMDVWWWLFSSKKQYDYEKIGPMRTDGDT
jgi:hypothetical protein